jgi:tetratricopeptide (TPR) repeat protein
MKELPEYVQARLYDMAMAMKEAHDSGSIDEVEEMFEEMREYCLDLVNEGNEHIQLWETLGDFAPDNDQALEYYESALVLAQQTEQPVHSILIGMGERRAAMEDVEEARELLKRGLHLAAEADDSEMMTRADILLSELPT